MEEHLLAKEAEENSVHQTTTQEEMMEENKNGIRAIHQKEEVALKTDLALRLQEIVLQEVEAEVDVVNVKGELSGKLYFGGNTMQELLESEGVQIKDDKIQILDKHFWRPE